VANINNRRQVGKGPAKAVELVGDDNIDLSTPHRSHEAIQPPARNLSARDSVGDFLDVGPLAERAIFEKYGENDAVTLGIKRQLLESEQRQRELQQFQACFRKATKSKDRRSNAGAKGSRAANTLRF
jgi:hypothetical protein